MVWLTRLFRRRLPDLRHIGGARALALHIVMTTNSTGRRLG